MSKSRTRSTKKLLEPYQDSTPRLLFQKELKSSTPKSKKANYDPFLLTKDKFVVHGRSVERSLWTRDRAPFRFLELPQELQDTILAYHYQPVQELCLEGVCSFCTEEELDDRFEVAHDCADHYTARIQGKLPSLAIERACRKLKNDSRAMRDKVWPTTLIIDEKVHVESIMKDFATRNKWDWLRSRTTSIVIKEISSYALSRKIKWNVFATICPQINSYSIHHRSRMGYVGWSTDECEVQAHHHDPDSQNWANLKPKTLKALAWTLYELHGKDFEVKVESVVWWSLMHTARQSYFEKVITYDFGHDSYEMVSKTYAVKELEDLRAAETRLNDDWSP